MLMLMILEFSNELRSWLRGQNASTELFHLYEVEFDYEKVRMKHSKPRAARIKLIVKDKVIDKDPKSLVKFR